MGIYKGITWGCFDGLTSAHLRVLKEARKCDYLIVGVSDDDYIRKYKGEPILDWGVRVSIISKMCDLVVPQSFYFTKRDAVERLNPDVIFVGEEYKDKDWDGKKLGIPIEYIEHNNLIHSKDIRYE